MCNGYSYIDRYYGEGWWWCRLATCDNFTLHSDKDTRHTRHDMKMRDRNLNHLLSSLALSESSDSLYTIASIDSVYILFLVPSNHC